MDKIIFLNNTEIKYNGTIIKTSDAVIDITFVDIVPDDETLMSGFYIENEFNGKDMTGDYYYGYNTIYRKFDKTLEVMLSNDGTIYVELVIIEPTEEPVIEPDVNPEEETETETETVIESDGKSETESGENIE